MYLLRTGRFLPLNGAALVFSLLILLFPAKEAISQPTDFGIGVQLGSPSGLSLHVGAQNRPSYDLLLAWDLGDYLFANLHFLYEQPIDNSSTFSWFYGPGAFGGIEGDWDGPPNSFKGDAYLGLSGTIGVSAYFDIFQIYLRLTPRLQLLERTDGDIGGGLGLRFYL